MPTKKWVVSSGGVIYTIYANTLAEVYQTVEDSLDSSLPDDLLIHRISRSDPKYPK